MGILSNGWVVGIASSLIAGILLSVLSYVFISKRRRREYLQRVNMANRELIYAVRPGIAESNIPSPDILEALSSATARSYGLKREELLTIRELGEELIKEVMDSSFLSSAQKLEYCEKLTPMQVTPTPPSGPISKDDLDSTKGKKQNVLESAAIGIIGTLVALLFTLTGNWQLFDKLAGQLKLSLLNLMELFILLAFGGVMFKTFLRDIFGRKGPLRRTLKVDDDNSEKSTKKLE